MFSNKRKKLVLLYDEACRQFSDREAMQMCVMAGHNPHKDFMDFFEQLRDPDFLEEEFVQRFWSNPRNFRDSSNASDQTLEKYVEMVLESCYCKTQEKVI